MSSFPPKCYYCNENDFGSVDRYERHIVTRHPDLPDYPGPVDIELYGLKKQGILGEGNKSKHGMEIVYQKTKKFGFRSVLI